MKRTNWAVAGVVVLVLAGVAAYFLYFAHEAPPPPPPVTVAAPAKPVPPAPPASAEAAVRYPLPTTGAALPALGDKAFDDALAGLLPGKRWLTLFIREDLIRRIVATVDALPGAALPPDTLPLKPVPGGFLTVGKGDALAVSARNAARYAPYVMLVQKADAGNAAQIYIAFYSLFQASYEELTNSTGYFNDRLVEALDDLLAAPEPAAPPKLLASGEKYRFADPDLDGRSAGQKIMLRMGVANAAAVKVKLNAFRGLVTAGAAPAKPKP